MTTDVLIAGGGPAGLIAALVLKSGAGHNAPAVLGSGKAGHIVTDE